MNFDERIAHERRVRQVEILRGELRLAGVSIKKLLPHWFSSQELRFAALTELLVALEAPIHEGLIPPYGSIIVPKDTDLSKVLPLKEPDLPIGRKAADGTSALLTYRGTELFGLMLLDPVAAPDLQLATLARHSDGIAFRRERTGVVRVHTAGGTLRHVGRQWSFGPSVGIAIERVVACAPMVDRRKLFEVLSFAYHVLSPWYIGATLVWLLTEENPFSSAAIDLRPLSLTVAPGPGAPSLSFAAHLLAQHDGATILSKDGELLSTGLQLLPSEQAQRLIAALPGTRHTSAKRASFDLPNTLIVTVSADGPVTVFSDGVNVFEWRFSASTAADAYRRSMGPYGRDAVWADHYMAQCPNCGKHSRIEEVTIAGYREEETASCPVCGKQVATGRCYHLHANVVKVL